MYVYIHTCIYAQLKYLVTRFEEMCFLSLNRLYQKLYQELLVAIKNKIVFFLI